MNTLRLWKLKPVLIALLAKPPRTVHQPKKILGLLATAFCNYSSGGARTGPIRWPNPRPPYMRIELYTRTPRPPLARPARAGGAYDEPCPLDSRDR